MEAIRVPCGCCGTATVLGEVCESCGRPLSAPRGQSSWSPMGEEPLDTLTGRGPQAPRPRVVRVVRGLLLFSMMMLGFGLLLPFLDAGVLRQSGFGLAFYLGGITFLLLLLGALWDAVGRAATAAWWVMLVGLCLSLLLKPLRLASTLMLLSVSPEAVPASDLPRTIGVVVVSFGLTLLLAVAWCRPQTRHWFRVR